MTGKRKVLKSSRDKLLQDINDVIWGWMNEKEISRKAMNYRPLPTLVAPTPVVFTKPEEKEEERVLNELSEFITSNSWHGNQSN